MKKSCGIPLLLAGLMVSSLTTFASTDEKSIRIDGEIQPMEQPKGPATVISLDLPNKLSFHIDPNNEDGNYFTASEFVLTNSSDLPLKVSVNRFEPIQEPDVYRFNDVLPDTHDNWLSLSEELSMQDFALGVKVVTPSQWTGPVRTETVWAKEVQDSQTPIELGVLEGQQGQATFTLEARHGLKFSRRFTTAYELNFYFEFTN